MWIQRKQCLSSWNQFIIYILQISCDDSVINVASGKVAGLDNVIVEHPDLEPGSDHALSKVVVTIKTSLKL
ncbi:hypothetical protein TanjilG_06251 [Lupinus angustifolius]|uniref:Uncharacterized protein n=1 Tax=Lupinus angustifolius TaxID=3871 RepID=A0A394DEG3_LUPAN|nr:hypothetical protein TanjilG_06251 [Lupinus angustifolius]